MDKRKIYHRLLSSIRWQRLRATYLTEHPMCETCAELGRYVPAAEVHHVRPIGTGRSSMAMTRLAYDPLNLRALCHQCHEEAHRPTTPKPYIKSKDRAKQEASDAIKYFLGD